MAINLDSQEAVNAFLHMIRNTGTKQVSQSKSGATTAENEVVVITDQSQAHEEWAFLPTKQTFDEYSHSISAKESHYPSINEPKTAEGDKIETEENHGTEVPVWIGARNASRLTFDESKKNLPSFTFQLENEEEKDAETPAFNESVKDVQTFSIRRGTSGISTSPYRAEFTQTQIELLSRQGAFDDWDKTKHEAEGISTNVTQPHSNTSVRDDVGKEIEKPLSRVINSSSPQSEDLQDINSYDSNAQQALDEAKIQLAARLESLTPKSIQTTSPSETNNTKMNEENELNEHTIGGKAKNEDSSIREIIFSDLPISADLTLIQSLIHGATIESMAILPRDSSDFELTASVMLTSANGCANYAARYQDGIDFRYEGRQFHAIVEKGQDSGPIPGVLQGYLDCGASRVVKVVKVDENVNTFTLRQLAEGGVEGRKLEKIVDQLRSGVRTVTFYFASIVDGVSFKSQLLKNEDWEAYNVTFIQDPCEKQKGYILSEFQLFNFSQ